MSDTRATSNSRGSIRTLPNAHRVGERNLDGWPGYQLGSVWVFYEDSELGMPCELWQGSTSLRGYPIRGDRNGGLLRVHREVWEREHGPLPAGMQIHHLCGHTNCINVTHMEALTDLEHAARHRTFDYDEAVALWRSGLTYREIGQAVGASKTAVSAAFARMRKRGEL